MRYTNTTCSLLLVLTLCVGAVFWGIVSWSKSVHPLIGTLAKTPTQGGGRYILVIDAGSSGTRMNAFRFLNPGDAIKSSDIMLIPPDAAKEKIPKRRIETRRAYQRVETEPGLSEFVSDFDGIQEQVLEPLLDWARAVVPKSEWRVTPVFLFATAGMRRLSPEKQERILERCRNVLSTSGFQFDSSSWARVIRGVDEGMYGWAALNAMENTLGGNDTLGALDLGGSSLEITYAVENSGEHTFPMILGGRTYNVYTYSHRHAGLDDAFQRSIQILEKNSAMNDSTIHHPCIHKGFRANVRRISLDGIPPSMSTVEVVGAPDGNLCDNLAELVVKRTAPCTEKTDNCVMSSHHPKFSGRFAAMSGFYVVNHFYNLNTKASVKKLGRITDSFCELDWDQVQNKHKGELAVETYCFRGEYVEALLDIGLELDNKKLMLGYKSPGWPLGAALVHGFSSSRSEYQTYIDPLVAVIGIICCVFVVYIAAKTRLYRVSGIRRRLKGGSLPSRGSLAVLSMEQGETCSGWHQTSTTGSSLSRSRTFSRRLSSLDANESL